MRLIVAAALIATALPVAAHAQDAAPPKEQKAADPAKKLCREQAETGSRFKKRICHTAAEWAQIDADNGNAANAALRGRGSGAR